MIAYVPVLTQVLLRRILETRGPGVEAEGRRRTVVAPIDRDVERFLRRVVGEGPGENHIIGAAVIAGAGREGDRAGSVVRNAQRTQRRLEVAVGTGGGNCRDHITLLGAVAILVRLLICRWRS